uniref:Uncharacterized protein n=1 Tax=Meloidogyne enterolobii TaxID=390850 RepID=A0A6V7XGV5_MELEN|nr:unnamed protein product [Meloidogyne enterolobii]
MMMLKDLRKNIPKDLKKLRGLPRMAFLSMCLSTKTLSLKSV